VIKKNEVDEACGTQGRLERCIQGFGEELKERDHLEDLGLDGRIILKLVFKKWGGEAWTKLIWLRIGTGGGSS